MNPPPRDFTNAAWRRSVRPRQIFDSIRDGVPGTAMPSWKGSLDDADIRALVAYVMSVGETRR
jgi:mono/diheme cytochrome c family protein